MPKKKGPTPRKHHIRLKVISEDELATRAAFVTKTFDGHLVFDGGNATNVVMDCGDCGHRLVQGMRVNQLLNLAMQCTKCGAYNATVEG